MGAKTERITILGTPEFKTFLVNQAKEQGISLSEFVRRRCTRDYLNEDEELLLKLIREVEVATKRAKETLEKGISDAETIITELRKANEHR